MTNRLDMRERPLVRSSVMPSLKYSCFGSSLIFVKGSTMIEGLSGRGSICGAAVLRTESWVLSEDRERYCMATISPTRTISPPSTKLRLDHDRIDPRGTGGSRGGASRLWTLDLDLGP